MIEYILIEKDTDEKASHAYFADDTPKTEIDSWLESINRKEYDIFKKIEG